MRKWGAKGGQSFGRRPLNTALCCSMKNGPSQPSPWVPSPDSVLPLGCQVGDAASWEWVVQPPPHSLNSQWINGCYKSRWGCGLPCKPPVLPLLHKPATPWPRRSFQNVVLFCPRAFAYAVLSASHHFSSCQILLILQVSAEL